MKRTVITALAGLALITALASCGKQSDLERPGPMWGAKAKAEYAAQKRAQADAATNGAESNRVVPNQNPAIEPFTTTAPVSQAPIPGEQTLPSGAKQPGSGPQ